MVITVAQGKIRIIGGDWRGRKLPVADITGLRPTPDRVRETLFNWLAWEVPASACLDLFAGSGALGLEAASRGAAQVTLVEQHPVLARHLQQQVTKLAASQVHVHNTEALHFLRSAQVTPFNIVFLDPPFGKDWLSQCCELLEQQGWLSADAFIYLEMEKALTELAVPANWQLKRQQTAGQVTYALMRRNLP